MRLSAALSALSAALALTGRAHAAPGEAAMTSAVGSPVPVLRAAPLGDRLWSAVVLATNPPASKPAPAELREFAPRLKRVFGYNQFALVGTATEKIDEDEEFTLMPCETLWLTVKARRAFSKEARGGYLLNVELFREKRPLLETEAKLAPGSPLFIRGPQYGKGQLIIVLQVQR